ncbi:MAG: c-type cytochrome [Planctomycetota bacterium]|nr:c-type cytochrome [Planctomycetota bacterium]
MMQSSGTVSARREIIFGVIVVAYLFVAVVAYTDHPRKPGEDPLTEFERAGLDVWRRNNCQVCHQIYGFGGFLGPDLTNRVTDEIDDEELSWILEFGSGRMPALDLSEDDQEAVLAYLRAVNRTGQSQPSPLQARRPSAAPDPFARLAAAWCNESGGDLEPAQRRGSEVWERFGCDGCHTPFAIGDNLAPDLSLSAVNRSVEALSKLFASGRGRMPAVDLSPAQVDDLCSYLEWFADHRSELVELNNRMLDRETFTWSGIPWFEYR